MFIPEIRILSGTENINLSDVHRFMANAYWARDRTLEQTELCLSNSRPFCVFSGTEQIGFARVISDRMTLAYLLDVFVAQHFQQRGIGTRLVETVLSHSDYRDVRRWMLRTADAQSLYSRFGFSLVCEGDTLMVREQQSFSQDG